MNKMLFKNDSVIFELAVNFFKEGREYIADCPALKLSTHGRTIKEAQKSFEEALSLWLEITLEKRMLKKVLKELGWTKEQLPTGRKIPKPKDSDFRKVPITIIAQKYYSFPVPYSAVK